MDTSIQQPVSQVPTKAFRIAAVAALITGAASYLIGLFNAYMQLNEKGYYLTVMLFGLFAVVSLQKTIRDKMAGMAVTRPYVIACGVATIAATALLAVGLYNAELALSEKGFFAMAYVLSLFAAITVQKNVRDCAEYHALVPADKAVAGQSGGE
ncbi:inner membrane protein YiaA [Alteromonas lipolytica]|uniref:YiaAB two helix domain-containing protein n=1 Tax=Alteromonas lipolytica TaxID=1856405 RepID=A0A1E8FDX3_9ALTE|nr:inner membrane protein YiaA [Alteromonas lipolytica]OFI33788.1 hypothetical protein BFC17_19650 [Alteromonas lipolytica]GGF68355.1 hypothetical protein GCM10011338_20730 [Alteromonas lipolytica]